MELEFRKSSDNPILSQVLQKDIYFSNKKSNIFSLKSRKHVKLCGMYDEGRLLTSKIRYDIVDRKK